MNRSDRIRVWLQTGVVLLGLWFLILGGSLYDWLVERLRFPDDYHFRGTFALSFALVPIGWMMYLTGWLREIQDRLAKNGDPLSTRAIVLLGVGLVFSVFVVELFHGRPATGMGIWIALLYFRYWWKSRQKNAKPVS